MQLQRIARRVLAPLPAGLAAPKQCYRRQFGGTTVQEMAPGAIQAPNRLIPKRPAVR